MIAITGATGKTGSKTAELLLNKGIKVRVIGRSGEKLKPFREKGAAIDVGDQGDPLFLTGAFSGCDAAYLLIPPKMDTPDFREYYNRLGDSAMEAIRESGLKKLVFLSSLGADLNAGTGPVLGLHDVELKLQKLTQTDVAVLRPGYFMENFLGNVPLIRDNGINGATLPPDTFVTMIATADIAKKAAELLETRSFTGHTIVELFGDRLTYKELTGLIGAAIGIPELSYVQFTDADVVKSLLKTGMSENLANSFVELASAIGKGMVRPALIDPLKPNTGTSFRKFAEETFKPVFKKSA
jgi:uncharacterized protein YbjT (DUF2867 family)